MREEAEITDQRAALRDCGTPPNLFPTRWPMCGDLWPSHRLVGIRPPSQRNAALAPCVPVVARCELHQRLQREGPKCHSRNCCFSDNSRRRLWIFSPVHGMVCRCKGGVKNAKHVGRSLLRQHHPRRVADSAQLRAETGDGSYRPFREPAHGAA